MVLGFKKQFVEKILNGEKIHSIRIDKNKRWKQNNVIHFATGVRTKNYNQFHHGTVRRVQEIIISRLKNGDWEIHVDGKYLSPFKCVDLANNDGFNTLNDFFQWFIPDKDFEKSGKARIDWHGRLIHWTDLRY